MTRFFCYERKKYLKKQRLRSRSPPAWPHRTALNHHSKVFPREARGAQALAGGRNPVAILKGKGFACQSFCGWRAGSKPGLSGLIRVLLVMQGIIGQSRKTAPRCRQRTQRGVQLARRILLAHEPGSTNRPVKPLANRSHTSDVRNRTLR